MPPQFIDLEHWRDILRNRFGHYVRLPCARYALPRELLGWFRVIEVDDAEAYAGELFRRCFHDHPPDFPRHFVALAEIEGEEQTIGYVNFARMDDVYLGGGMCMDDRAFRRLSADRRTKLKSAGGVAEQMLRYSFAHLSDAKGIFGYVGNARAERVDLRAGFRHTGVEYLVVYWPNRLSASKKKALVDRVAKIGPF